MEKEVKDFRIYGGENIIGKFKIDENFNCNLKFKLFSCYDFKWKCFKGFMLFIWMRGLGVMLKFFIV